MKRSERAEPEVITHAGVAAEQGQHPLLESMVAAPVGRAPACLVGECVHDAHPTLLGRVRVRWTEPGQGGEVREQWLACLLGVIVRQQDRVLLQLPDNWPEPVVTGVVDGFAMRPEAARLPGPSVDLRGDESLRVRGEDGQQLLEIFQEEGGPVVRLLDPDLHLELPGELRIRAEQITLEATRGDVELRASDDVNVLGEMIHLNP